jgi:hypothetical protein
MTPREHAAKLAGEPSESFEALVPTARQEHPPGRMGLSGFTAMGALITA